MDWTFPAEVDTWVDEIESKDPRSTLFRYPNPRNTAVDVPKAVMAESTPTEIMARLAVSKDGPKQLILLMENEAGDVTSGYYYTGDSQAHFNAILKDCAEMFYGTHAALRAEVCGGA